MVTGVCVYETGRQADNTSRQADIVQGQLGTGLCSQAAHHMHAGTLHAVDGRQDILQSAPEQCPMSHLAVASPTHICCVVLLLLLLPQ